MKEMKTPHEWTVKTLLYPKTTVSNEYNFDRAVYSDIPGAVLNLCWQPVEDSTAIQERGEAEASSYTAVVYDSKIKMHKGDMLCIDGLGYLLITSIKRYLTYRHITARSTDRRLQNVKD